MTECRQYQGARTRNGYGRRYDRQRKKVVLVHRWVWEQIHGPIPPGLMVLHTCDTPACFLLEHLYLGTNSDNMRDRSARGRDHGLAHLTHCRQGHRLADVGVVGNGHGRFTCGGCKRERDRRYDMCGARSTGPPS